MSRSRGRAGPPRAGAVLRRLAVAALALAALGVRPDDGSAQAETLVAQELEYRSARSDAQAARDARNVVERRFSDALEEVSRARRSGDAGRLETALAQAQTLSLELNRVDERVRQEEGDLEASRRRLLAALDQRRRQLERSFADARTPRQRSEIDTLIRDLANQYREVEDARGDVLETRLVYFPSITFDPRDGALELEAKADLLERKAEALDTMLSSVDREIERLESLLRLQRSRESFQGNLERFGDTQVPVGPPTRRGARDGDPPEARPDSSGVLAPQAPLDQRVRSLRLFRLQVEGARDQFLARARVFRQLMRRGP